MAGATTLSVAEFDSASLAAEVRAATGASQTTAIKLAAAATGHATGTENQKNEAGGNAPELSTAR